MIEPGAIDRRWPAGIFRRTENQDTVRLVRLIDPALVHDAQSEPEKRAGQNDDSCRKQPADEV